jgi:hypothetical protein
MMTSSSPSDFRQASSLLLCSNKRVISFCWTKGSKLGFLTIFSYFSCYFLILGFLLNHYFLVSLHLSWLHRNQISLSCFLILEHSQLVCWTCTPCFRHRLCCYTQSKTFVGPWSILSTGLFSILTLCQRLLVQTSSG